MEALSENIKNIVAEAGRPEEENLQHSMATDDTAKVRGYPDYKFLN
jgi:hypothetical protein